MEERARKYLDTRLREAGIPSLRIAVVLGSGLGEAAPDMPGTLEVEWCDIPGWPECGVPGHAGAMRCGIYGGVGLLVQLGRLHYYEGLGMEAVTLPVRLMASLGVESVFLANAAGALNPVYERGCLMLVRDHINLMGVNPLRGVRDAEGCPAFLDVSSLYDERTSDMLQERAKLSGWPMEGGTLVGVSGPTFETGAELRYLRLIGGDAVSMSLVPEALMARYLGLSVTGVSVITNVWDLRKPRPVSHREVLDTAADAAPVLRDIIASWVEVREAADRFPA